MRNYQNIRLLLVTFCLSAWISFFNIVSTSETRALIRSDNQGARPSLTFEPVELMQAEGLTHREVGFRWPQYGRSRQVQWKSNQKIAQKDEPSRNRPGGLTLLLGDGIPLPDGTHRESFIGNKGKSRDHVYLNPKSHHETRHDAGEEFTESDVYRWDE